MALFVKGQKRLPGAGRKKGTPNKATVEKRLADAEKLLAVAVLNEEPIDYMLRVMRDPTADLGRRDQMARAAAPYRHPQLQAVAHKLVDANVLKPPEPVARLSNDGPKDGETVQ